MTSLCSTTLLKQFKHVEPSLGMCERMRSTTIAILCNLLRRVDVFSTQPCKNTIVVAVSVVVYFVHLFFIDRAISTYSLLSFRHPLTFIRKRHCWCDAWRWLMKVLANKNFVVKHDFTLGNLFPYESIISSLLASSFAIVLWSC